MCYNAFPRSLPRRPHLVEARKYSKSVALLVVAQTYPAAHLRSTQNTRDGGTHMGGHAKSKPQQLTIPSCSAPLPWHTALVTSTIAVSVVLLLAPWLRHSPLPPATGGTFDVSRPCGIKICNFPNLFHFGCSYIDKLD